MEFQEVNWPCLNPSALQDKRRGEDVKHSVQQGQSRRLRSGQTRQPHTHRTHLPFALAFVTLALEQLFPLCFFLCTPQIRNYQLFQALSIWTRVQAVRNRTPHDYFCSALGYYGKTTTTGDSGQ